jgi:hypothetical protein
MGMVEVLLIDTLVNNLWWIFAWFFFRISFWCLIIRHYEFLNPPFEVWATLHKWIDYNECLTKFVAEFLSKVAESQFGEFHHFLILIVVDTEGIHNRKFLLRVWLNKFSLSTVQFVSSLRRIHNVLLSSRTAGDPRLLSNASFKILTQKMSISRWFLCVHKCKTRYPCWQKSWDGSVGIAADYTLGGRGSICGRDKGEEKPFPCRKSNPGFQSVSLPTKLSRLSALLHFTVVIDYEFW